MFEWLSTPEAWMALATLTALEIVLGIDNIIFITVLVGRLPESQRKLAVRVGLGLAMGARLALLFSITWVMGLTEEWFSLFSEEFSGRDVIMMVGGLFLLAKSTHEIHNSLEGVQSDGRDSGMVKASLGAVLAQIAMLDVIFSLDSVITAVGMVDNVTVMAAAIILAVGVMLAAAQSVSEFVERHPTMKMLALSFLILVGVTLIVEGFDIHVPKGYIYFAITFSLAVEILNIHVRKTRTKPILLRKKIQE